MTFRFSLLLMLLQLLWTQPVLAERLSLGALPGITAKAGFGMSVEMECVAGNGYSPIYLNFTSPTGSFTRQRRLTVTLSPRTQYRNDLELDWTTHVEIPEGAKTHEVCVYVPYYFGWDYLRATVSEGGRPIEGATAILSVSNLRTHAANQRCSVGIMVPRNDQIQDAPWKKFPDIRTLVTVLGEGPLPATDLVERLSHQAAKDLARAVQPAWVQFREINEADLRPQWLGYSQLDVILAPAPLLERIEQEQPQEMEALKLWLASGGNLWVYAADSTRLSWIPQDAWYLLPSSGFVAPSAVPGMLNLHMDNDTTEIEYQYWQGVTKRSQNYQYQSTEIPLEKRSEVFQKLDKMNHPFARITPTAQLAAMGTKLARFGAGTLMIMPEADPFPGSFQFWQSLALATTEKKLNWSTRHGVDVSSGNDTYWSWLIGTVGTPPVKYFLILNSLFVLVVGPISYWFFRKRQRLYLLYFSAPALALAVTTGLFAFALFADGFRTRLRVRQITRVDAASQYAVTQSRQTYYSVMGSRDGLLFPAEAMILPLRNAPEWGAGSSSLNSSSSSRIFANEEIQKFSGDYLPARTQVQYLSVRPRQMSHPFEMELQEETLRVTNRSATEVAQLFVTDAEQQLWAGGELQPGATGTMQKVSWSEWPKVVEEMEIAPFISTSPVPVLRAGRWRGWWGRSRSTGSHLSVLETEVQQWLAKIPAKSFLGLVEIDAEDLGYPDAQRSGSVHFIMGEWP